MKSLTASLSCPRCGGELLHEGYDVVVQSPDLGWADCRCDKCLDMFRVTISVTMIEAWPVNKLDATERSVAAAATAYNYLDTSW